MAGAGSIPVPTPGRPLEGHAGCRVFNLNHLFRALPLLWHRGSPNLPEARAGKRSRGRPGTRSLSDRQRGPPQARFLKVVRARPGVTSRPAPPRPPPAPTRPPVQESRGHAPPRAHWLPLRRRGAAAPPIGRAGRPSAPPVNTSPAPVTTVRGCGRTSCALSASPAPLLRHRRVPRGTSRSGAGHGSSGESWHCCCRRALRGAPRDAVRSSARVTPPPFSAPRRS